MAQQGTGNVKQTLSYLGNAVQARSRKKNGTGKGGTLIHALKKRLKERGKRKPLKRGWPPNLLNIAFCGLRLLACILAVLLAPRRSRPCSKCPCSMRIHEMTKETSNRQAKKQIEGKHAKKQASKRCQTGANKHVIKQNGVS